MAIPLSIRTKCATRREEDDDPIDDNFVYTTLIELKEILNKNWREFQDVLPRRWADRKKEFLSALCRLNGIRNAVMHPVKNRQWTEDDFDFVRDFKPGLHEFIENYRRDREAIKKGTGGMELV
jgi:hypothetical protein